MKPNFYKLFFAVTGIFLLNFFAKGQTITTVVNPAGVMDMPWNIAVDASGNLYTADYSLHKIYKINPATGVVTTIAGTGSSGFNGDNIPALNARLNYPTGIAIDKSGDIFIADTDNNRIRKITVSTGIITTVAGTGIENFSGDGGPAVNAEISYPYSICFDAFENLFFADYGNGRVRKVNKSDGLITTVAGGSDGSVGGLATNASLYYPQAVTVDGANNIYIADLNNKIYKVTASNGILSLVAGNGTYGYNGDNIPATDAGLGYSGAIATDAHGNIFFADGDNNRIRKITASTGIITTVAGNGTYGDIGDGSNATSASLASPQGLVLHGGNIFVANTGSGSIRKVANAYTILPVKLISFTARKERAGVMLQWQTSDENNHRHFVIQHSIEGINWKDIGIVDSTNQSYGNYSFLHSSPSTINFYRLKQVDLDGGFAFSTVRKLSFNFNSHSSISPNPVNGNTIKLHPSAPVTESLAYTISAASGKTVNKGTIDGQDLNINIGNLIPGVYFLRLSNGEIIKFFTQ